MVASRRPVGLEMLGCIGVCVAMGLVSGCRGGRARTPAPQVGPAYALRPADAKLLERAAGGDYPARMAYVGQAQLSPPRERARLLEAAVERLPNDAKLRLRLAVAYCKSGQWANAQAAARQSAAIDPGDADARPWLLVARVSEGSFPDLKRISVSVRVAVARGVVLVWPDTGRGAELPAGFPKLIPDWPLGAAHLRMEGALAAGDDSAAGRMARLLLVDNQDDARALIVQGVLQLRAGDAKAAKGSFSAANEHQQMASEMGLAACRARAGDAKGALRGACTGAFLSDLAESIWEPTSVCAYPNCRAMWQLIAAEMAAAPAAAEDQMAAAACTKGLSSYFLGNSGAAAEDFRAAVRSKPGIQPAADYLAEGRVVPASLGAVLREGEPGGSGGKRPGKEGAR